MTGNIDEHESDSDGWLEVKCDTSELWNYTDTNTPNSIKIDSLLYG